MEKGESLTWPEQRGPGRHRGRGAARAAHGTAAGTHAAAVAHAAAHAAALGQFRGDLTGFQLKAVLFSCIWSRRALSSFCLAVMAA